MFAAGDIKDSFVEDENKVDIEETSINLGCVKNEPNEEAFDLEEDSHATRYRITLGYDNIFEEPSHQIKIEEDSDNLIGFLDNDAVMENTMIKLEGIKEEDVSFNNFYCSKCKEIYKGYCMKCSTLLCILNNSLAVVTSESELNTIPTDILEIRETSRGKGVYLLRALAINIIFGPFDGISAIESAVGHSWKIVNNKLKNMKFGNWMKNIVCAPNASLQNLKIFQIDGNLYFQTNREITEGEELLIYYDDEELQQLDNNEEFLYTPQKLDKLPKIFACTVCCLGFGSNKCLMEHKRKSCRMEHSRSIKDFVLVECHYCKMWLEKWEHEEYHVAYCLEKHHRMWSSYSEPADRSDTRAKEMEGDCGTRAGKRTNSRDICSRPFDGSDDLQSDAEDYQCSSGEDRESPLNESGALVERSNNEQIQNTIGTKHLNKHRGIKRFTCDICMKQFGQKGNLKIHIINKHTDDGRSKDYKCSECSYKTNYKSNLRRHLNMHRGIKPFKCDICATTFTERNYLAKHIKNKHTDDGNAKDYKCFECSFKTKYNCNLQKHLNTHRGIKRFQCDICMAKFTQKGSLGTHIKSKHTKNVNLFKCDICTKEFTLKCNLEIHIKHKHTKNVDPFTCDICKTKFTLKSNLKIHIKNHHTNDRSAKDFKCLECSYQTDYKYNLLQHLTKHSGIKPFKCDTCMKKFTLKGSLKAHIRNSHTKNVNRFTCDICMMTFAWKCTLRSHIKKKHRDDVSV